MKTTMMLFAVLALTGWTACGQPIPGDDGGTPQTMDMQPGEWIGTMFLVSSDDEDAGILPPYTATVSATRATGAATEASGGGWVLRGICPDGSGASRLGEATEWDGGHAMLDTVVCRVADGCDDTAVTITAGSARIEPDGKWLTIKATGNYHTCGTDTAVSGRFDGRTKR